MFGLELPSQKTLRDFTIYIIAGAIGGSLAYALNLPLPFMLGGLMAAICVVLIGENRGHHLAFPRFPRMIGVGIIGVMIGGTFSPEVVEIIPSLGISLAAITLFVFTAHATAFGICRYIGRYDTVTAFYSAMPGGLIEAVALGERAGSDVRILTLQHFMRVMTVVILLPIYFYISSGEIVGSAAGQTFAGDDPHVIDIEYIVLITAVGLAIGKLLRVPAAHLLGPMILSAALHGMDVIQIQSPAWLLFLAQLVVGAGLGSQFSGTDKTLVRHAAMVNVLMVSAMLVLAALFAYGLTRITKPEFDALLLSFAPGGVTETGLIALSMAISPVVVASHHVYRIFLTVLLAALSTKSFKPVSDQD